MVLPNKKNYNDNAIATWALWTFIIMSLLVIIICVVCLIIFSTHYADYKWREVGEIEYIRYPTDFDNGTFMSQKNTEAGWYKEIDNNCNDREASINCKQYEEWPGYSEEDLNYISIGISVIFAVLTVYSIVFFVIACMYYMCDYFIIYLCIYIAITGVIEVCLAIFEWCQIDRYNKKQSLLNQTETTESYTPYKFMNDISEKFSNVKKMLRRY